MTRPEIFDAAKARRIEKKSVGFFGYDWMIESLIKNGYIHTETEARP